MSQSGSWKFTPEATALVSQLINSVRWMTRGRAQGPECLQPVMQLEQLSGGWGWEGRGLGVAGGGAGWAPWCWLPLQKGRERMVALQQASQEYPLSPPRSPRTTSELWLFPSPPHCEQETCGLAGRCHEIYPQAKLCQAPFRSPKGQAEPKVPPTGLEGFSPDLIWPTPYGYQQGLRNHKTPLCSPNAKSRNLINRVIYFHLVQQLKQIHIFQPSP